MSTPEDRQTTLRAYCARNGYTLSHFTSTRGRYTRAVAFKNGIRYRLGTKGSRVHVDRAPVTRATITPEGTD